jgi:hypothetical protein
MKIADRPATMKVFRPTEWSIRFGTFNAIRLIFLIGKELKNLTTESFGPVRNIGDSLASAIWRPRPARTSDG